MKKTLILLFIPFICIGQLKFLPESKGEFVKHTYYSLSYVEKHEQAEWVHYRLDSRMLKGKEKRKKNYIIDRKVSTGSANTKDYTNSGYDRGHLVPAADLKMNLISLREATYMSNISPQKKDFNGGEWYELEKHVRSLAKENELYITTGGVLSCDLDSIGKKNKVSVPELFYKIIYDAKNEKMTAYLMPNRKLHSSFENHIVTVDLIETLTGIDFYHQLEDELEKRLESGI
jgi:endonuclease G, mitochondrial